MIKVIRKDRRLRRSAIAALRLRRSAIAASLVLGATAATGHASASGDDDDGVKVAVVLTSAANDLAFSQSMVDSLERLVEAVVIDEYVFSENMFVVEDAAAALRDYAEAGHDLVIAHGSQYGGSLQEIAPDFRKMRNRANHYQPAREMQRKVNVTGMATFLAPDSMATESRGPLYDRSREHLGASDKGVIAVRRRLLDAAKAVQAGQTPPHIVTDPARNDFRHVDTLAVVIDGRDWHAAFPHLVGSAPELPRELATAAGSRG